LKNVLWKVLKVVLAGTIAPVCATLGVEGSGQIETVVSHVGVVLVTVERNIDRSRREINGRKTALRSNNLAEAKNGH
jgi:hypothetical protein